MTHSFLLGIQNSLPAAPKDHFEVLLEFAARVAWPLVTLLLVWGFRKHTPALFDALASAIRKGGLALKVGSYGLDLGQGQSPSPQGAERVPKKCAPEGGRLENGSLPKDLPHRIYMTHFAWRDRGLDQRGLPYYRLQIALDADEPALLAKVEKVVYHLHETFPNPMREVADPRDGFAIRTSAWGEFNMCCEVHWKDGKILALERYINFLNPAR